MGKHSKGLGHHSMGKHSKGLDSSVRAALGCMGKPSTGLGQHGAAWGNTLKGWGIMGKHGETL